MTYYLTVYVVFKSDKAKKFGQIDLVGHLVCGYSFLYSIIMNRYFQVVMRV